MKKRIKLTANILFSGIGCQERGFRDSGLFDIEVLNTSDINKESVVSYAAIHCGMTNEIVKNYTDYPTRNEMAQYLTDINLGYEPDKKKGNKEFDWFKLVKKNTNDLEKYWLACKLSNNLGDISRIDELPYADFWTVSFPCTDISIAGKIAGLEPDSGTRSSLLWENIRLLNKAKDNNIFPKYIMVENVKNLVSKKFIKHFKELLDIFDNLGFNSYWSVINGKDCGIPQNRERVFVIAIRKDIDAGKYTFPNPFDTGIRLKDVLEDEVDEKYYLSGLLSTDYKQPKQIIETPEISYCLDANYYKGTMVEQYVEKKRWQLIFEDTKNEPCIRIRKLTPRECFRLQGLTFEDCDKASKLGIANTHLYRQAGNGIITNCCALLAEHLYKAQYDDTYICTDERYQENFTSPQVE